MFHGFANGLADGWGYSTRLHWRAHARPEIYIQKKPQPWRTTVKVKQTLASLSDSVLHVGLRVKGLLSLQPDWSGALSAVSSAEAYFDRYEPRSDGEHERSNLFQPFWMARNVLTN